MTAEDFVNAKVIKVYSNIFPEYKEGLNEFEVENSLGLFWLEFEYYYENRDNVLISNESLKLLDNDEEPEIEITHKQVEQWIDKQRNF